MSGIKNDKALSRRHTDTTDMRKDIAQWNEIEERKMSKTEERIRSRYSGYSHDTEETIMVMWLEEVAKDKPNRAVYGFEEVKKLVESGNFTSVLVSNNEEWKEVRQLVKMMGRHPRIMFFRSPEPRGILESFGGYATLRVRP